MHSRFREWRRLSNANPIDLRTNTASLALAQDRSQLPNDVHCTLNSNATASRPGGDDDDQQKPEPSSRPPASVNCSVDDLP